MIKYEALIAIWMSCYIRTYIIPFAIIAGAVGRSDRSTVNLKQCSGHSLNDDKGNGLVYVSTFVYWNNSRSNVDATNMILYL